MKLRFIFILFALVIFGCEKKEPNPELEFAYSYLLKGEYEAAKLVLDKAKISQDDSADFKLLSGVVDISRLYIGLIDTTFIYDAPARFEDEEKHGWALFAKGTVTYNYRPVNEWEDAVYILNQAYDIGKSLNIRELCFQSAFSAALCCSNSGNYDSFKKFCRRMNENAATPYQKAISLECMRYSYTFNGQEDSAALCAKEAFRLVKDLEEYPQLTNPIYVSYADIICMEDDSTAEKYMLKVLETNDYSNPYRILAKIYLKRGDISKAEDYFAKASSFGDIWFKNEIELCQLFAETYASKGLWEKAFVMQKRIAETERIQSQRVNPQISSAQQHYEDEVLKKLELSERRQRNTIIISCLVFVILSLLTLVLYLKHKHEKLQSQNRQILKESQDKIDELRAADKTEENMKEINRLQKKITEIENRYADIYREGRSLYDNIFSGGGSASQWSKSDFDKFIEYYKTLDLSLIVQIEEEYPGLNPRQIFYKILQAKGFEKERIMSALGIFTDGAFRALKSKVEAKKKN